MALVTTIEMRFSQVCTTFLYKFDFLITCRPVASRGGGRGAPLLFGRSVNPISTRGCTLSPPSIKCPPDFQTLHWPCDVFTNLESANPAFFQQKLLFVTICSKWLFVWESKLYIKICWYNCLVFISKYFWKTVQIDNSGFVVWIRKNMLWAR